MSKGFLESLLLQFLRALFKAPSRTLRQRSASYDHVAREAADTATRILRAKNKDLKTGFFQLHALEPKVDLHGALSFMAEFLRYKRNEYILVGFLVAGKLHEIWVTMGTTTKVTFYLDNIAERAVGIGCTRIIFGHNHPGPFGALVTSPEDRQVKKDLASRLGPLSIGFESYIFNRGHYVSY